VKEYTDKELKERLEQQNRPLSGIYYWITVNHNGKNIVIGYKGNETEANQYAYEKCSGEYKIIPLKTRDINTAIRLMKGKILDDTANIDRATEKFNRKEFKQ
jgi:hypothetical protein